MGLADLERREQTITLFQHRQKVTVSDLARHFKVSESTIRRDLAELEREGLIRKVYGGAVLTSPTVLEFNFQERLERNIEWKRAIGAHAAGMVKPGQSILLDSGTTALQVAKHLPPNAGLTIVTNGLAIAEALSALPGIRLYVLGGCYRPESRDLVGPTLTECMRHFSVDTAFVCVDGFHPEHGFTTTDHEVAEVAQMALGIAQQKIVVADSTKGGRRAFARICDIDAVDAIVTDRQLDKALLAELRQKNVRVVTV